MAQYPEHLLKAAEDGYFLIDDGGVRIRPFAFDDVEGRITDFDHEDINMVRCVPGSAEIGGEVIDCVMDRYRTAGVPCCWLVTPLSPPGLVEKLEARGFRNHLTDLAMIVSDYGRVIRDIEGVAVKRGSAEDKEVFSRIIAESFGDSLDMSEYLFDVMWKRAEEFDLRIYLAWRDGVDGPVGAAASVRLPGSSLVQLEVAGVLGEHRKKGVYTAMVSERIRDARSTGAEGVIIQAKIDTSAPVCAAMGFEKLCRHDFYLWRPESLHLAD